MEFSQEEKQMELWADSSNSIPVTDGYSIAVKVDDDSTPAIIEDLVFVHEYSLIPNVNKGDL